MFAFVVLFLGASLVKGIQLGDPSALHFDSNHEYATSYGDYKPSDYNFQYGVSDPHTGDHKSHWEVKENGVVRGEYSLLEPDGTTRIVQYTADDIHGFRATVKKIGTSIHPISEKYQKNPVLAEESLGIHNTEVYKTYDGSANNYHYNSPHIESNHANDLLNVQYLVQPLSENLVSLKNVPYYYNQNQQSLGDGIQNINPLEQPLSVFDTVGIIKNTQYIPSNTQSALGEITRTFEYPNYASSKVQLLQHVPSISNDFQYSTIPIQHQNIFDNIQKNYPRSQYSSIQTSSLGIRTEHPVEQSSW